ncbi:MAG: hypothetical protein DCC71_18870 [Proteobacteria bacterium]|nr:MAG: hypothetical protein DCC71_18870 [Pseudomonadota bacterium]
MPSCEMRILQCGFPKSGNYGVQRLLAAILDAHGLRRSYKRRVGLARVAEAFGSLMFPEAAEVDAFSFASGRCRLEFPHAACRWLDVDPALLLDGSNLLWTHDPCEVALRPELAAVTHRVYVLRDGRDVVDSLVHHVVRPEVRALQPEYRYATPAQVYADERLFASYARRWAEHVASWLRARERFVLVRFEELASDPAGVAAKLAHALGMAADAEEIGAAVSFRALRAAAPGHLRRGAAGGFRDAFGAAQRRVFDAVAGDVLAAAGYAREADAA